MRAVRWWSARLCVLCGALRPCAAADRIVAALEAELLEITRDYYPHGDIGMRKHTYEQVYAQHLGPLRHDPLKFMEIGLGCNMPSHARRGDGIGLSVPFWRKYLPNAEIWMAEYDAKCVEPRRARNYSGMPWCTKL